MKGHLDRDHASFKGHDGLENYQYLANDTPTKMPRPEERGMKIAPKKAGAPKLGQFQQSAFAAQNLEDLAIYDVDKDDACMECRKKMTAIGHFKYVDAITLLLVYISTILLIFLQCLLVLHQV